MGTALLLAGVVGSGVMAERLAGGNEAITLLCNTIPTGAILVVLILMFGPTSGAHFNPVMSVVFALKRELSLAVLPLYVGAQVAGAVLGVVAAHAMFELPPLELSATTRTGSAQWLAEMIATFGLVGCVLGTRRSTPGAVPYAVGLYITAAYWFTASTSFANPAVTIARSLTATFTGIALLDVPAFVAAEFIGGLLAVAFFGWLHAPSISAIR